MKNLIIVNTIIIMIAVGKIFMGNTPVYESVMIENVEVVTYAHGDTGIEGDINYNGKIIPVVFNTMPEVGTGKVKENMLIQDGKMYTFKQIESCTAEGCTTY